MKILKIVIQDLGSFQRPNIMQPAKWVADQKIREYNTVGEIDHQFDREHVEWMIENKQQTSHLGERVYQIIEDVK